MILWIPKNWKKSLEFSFAALTVKSNGIKRHAKILRESQCNIWKACMKFLKKQNSRKSARRERRKIDKQTSGGKFGKQPTNLRRWSREITRWRVSKSNRGASNPHPRALSWRIYLRKNINTSSTVSLVDLRCRTRRADLSSNIDYVQHMWPLYKNLFHRTLPALRIFIVN